MVYEFHLNKAVPKIERMKERGKERKREKEKKNSTAENRNVQR